MHGEWLTSQYVTEIAADRFRLNRTRTPLVDNHVEKTAPSLCTKNKCATTGFDLFPHCSKLVNPSVLDPGVMVGAERLREGYTSCPRNVK